jgi:hypothetical protein
MGPVGQSQELLGEKPARVAFYIDAFNLYFGIVKLNQPHLKWIDLWGLCQGLLSKHDQRLTKVVFCTAYNRKDESKLRRHQAYVKVLRHLGVACVEGHYIHETRTCNQCAIPGSEASESKPSDLFHFFMMPWMS